MTAHFDSDSTGAAKASGWVNRGVVAVAAASAFSDLGHEIGTSLLPTLLTTTLHAGPGALGIIEGSSDALIGVSKLAGGPLANDPDRRAAQASGGYLVTGVASGALGAVGSVWQAGVARAIGWSARGLRSPARDALLFDLVEPGSYGRAAGAERAGDNAGALLGPLLASLLLTVVGIRTTLYLSAIPGAFAAVAITIAGREARRTLSTRTGRRTLSLNIRALHNAGLARTLAPAAAFELGNIAATLLILRSTELLQTGGRSLTRAAAVAVLLYAAHNGAATVASLGGGHWADRRGPRLVFGMAAAVYAASYALFAVGSHRWPILLAGFLAAGIGIGLAETAEATMVAQIAPPELRGSAFGLLGLTQALGDLGSSAVVGVLWAGLAPAVGFGYAAGWMVIAIVAIILVARRRITPAPEPDRPF